jgi:hypothetical protein
MIIRIVNIILIIIKLEEKILTMKNKMPINIEAQCYIKIRYCIKINIIKKEVGKMKFLNSKILTKKKRKK